MMRIFVVMLFAGAMAPTIAANVQQTDPQEEAAVLGELSQRSGLPNGELQDLLHDCSANQQSIYFCAWRDQVAADRAFRRMLADKEGQMPQCKTAVEAKIARWKRHRDQSCDKAAAKEWGNGSMKPTAQTMCVTAEIARMMKRLQLMEKCQLP